jgi:hypothetical protein
LSAAVQVFTMKELSALFLAIIAIIFIHATNKSEEKNPVDKKRKDDQKGNDRRGLQDKQVALPVAAFASNIGSGNWDDGFNSRLNWQNPHARNLSKQSSNIDSKISRGKAGTAISYDPSYLFYYQRLKFSKGLSSNVK